MEWKGKECIREKSVLRCGRPLGAAEGRIPAVALQELLVGALLRNATAVDDHDAVGAADGGEPVGDDQSGPAPGQFVKGGLDALLRDAVQGGSGLVQNEDGRVLPPWTASRSLSLIHIWGPPFPPVRLWCWRV